MAVREEKIILEPMNIIWGSREKTKITCVADVASSLGGKFFKLHTALDAVKYQVWFDVGNLSVAPALLAGYTLLEVDIAANDSAATVAAALKAKLDTLTYFNSSQSSADVIVENNSPGKATLTSDGTAPTAFTFLRQKVSKGRDLGGSQGGVEMAFEVNLVDVKADQTGEQILDQINNATNLSLSMTLTELTQENWELLLGEVIGEIITSGPDTFVGLGESKRFANMSKYAMELVLSPVNAPDKKRDHNFWKVYPQIESVNFSGSDLSNMSVTWRPIRDTKKDNKYNLFMFGDGSNTLFADLT